MCLIKTFRPITTNTSAPADDEIWQLCHAEALDTVEGYILVSRLYLFCHVDKYFTSISNHCSMESERNRLSRPDIEYIVADKDQTAPAICKSITKGVKSF